MLTLLKIHVAELIDVKLPLVPVILVVRRLTIFALFPTCVLLDNVAIFA